MSTQTPKSPAIPLSVTQPFPSSNIRLLEIPEELLDIITSQSSDLYFKSSPPHPQSGLKGGSEREGNLHLCTDEKLWVVKQVSTSNSVYISRAEALDPGQSVDSDDGDGGGKERDRDDDVEMYEITEVKDDEVEMSSIGMTAFAKPTSILELYPVPEGSYERTAIQHLERLIPKIESAEDLKDTTLRDLAPYSMQDLHDHIPVPREMIKKILAQRCVSILPRSTSGDKAQDTQEMVFIPHRTLFLNTWKHIIESATLSETPITAHLDTDTLLSVSSDPDNDEVNLYKAVAHQMFAGDGYFVSVGLIGKSKGTQGTENGWLIEIEAARWVGNMILRVEGAMEKEEFEKTWEDAVPASWVKYCSVEVLGTSCSVDKDDKGGRAVVSMRPFVIDSGTTRSSKDGVKEADSADSKPAAIAASSKGKRKWHEKFAAQRNVKR